jgi:hypothetical protein
MPCSGGVIFRACRQFATNGWADLIQAFPTVTVTRALSGLRVVLDGTRLDLTISGRRLPTLCYGCERNRRNRTNCKSDSQPRRSLSVPRTVPSCRFYCMILITSRFGARAQVANVFILVGVAASTRDVSQTSLHRDQAHPEEQLSDRLPIDRLISRRTSPRVNEGSIAFTCPTKQSRDPD